MRLLLPIALLLLASVARADVTAAPQFKTGNDLYQLCSASPLFACADYVSGAVDMLIALDAAEGKCRYFKLKDGVRPEELGEIVANYLRDHPDERDRAAISSVLRALMAEFRC